MAGSRPTRFDGGVKHAATVALVVLAGLLAATHARLARLERSAIALEDVELEGGVPATLLLPEADAPPPGVVIVHGFSGDRAMTSTLSRRLAANGYAALGVDLRGHGESPGRFPPGVTAGESVLEFGAELAAAVDFLRFDPRVDGSRIALVGHSMGSRAVLDYASRDSALDAVVMISGATEPRGPFPPANPLFLWAAGDPPRVEAAVGRVAPRLAGVETLEPGRTRGDPARGTAVRTREIPGHDHLSILWSEEAAREILAWLDASCEVSRASPPTLSDPRLAWALAALVLFVVVLPLLGDAIGRFAPAGPPLPAGGHGPGLGALAGVLLLTLPVAGAQPLASFLGVAVAEFAFGHLALAGIVLLAMLGLGRPGLGVGRSLVASLPAAAGGFALVFALLAPLGVVAHRLVPTPERALAAVLGTLLLLPFFVAFELLLRRGSAARALGWALGGRVVLLAALLVGVRLGLTPRVVGLVAGVLAALFVLIEILATAIHARARNPFVIAWIESGWLAWIVAATMPLR